MITILITLGALPSARREPVLAALRSNLAHGIIRDIQVVTEAPAGETMDWLYDAAGSEAHRLNLIHVAARPTFAEMLEMANQLLISGSDTVAVMNGDISFASEADGRRILDALEALEARKKPVVLALTRHEIIDGNFILDLYEPNGLPNTISADAWVFQKPLSVKRDFFYMPGQMNCDMMLAHDLISTDHRLYNPCLDITIVHHELPKDDAYYQEKNLEIGEQENIWKHAKLNHVEPWNYYGTPWVRSSWLKLGYRPAANSTHGRRLMLALPEGSEHRLGALLPDLARLIAAHDLEVQILFDGNLDVLVLQHADALAKQPRIWFVRPQHSINATRRALLVGKHYSFDRLAFVKDLSRVDDALMAAAEGVFVTLSANSVTRPPSYGCTLITSVFRSDPFLQGFVRNSTALVGYARLMEHIFLVSALSDIEIDVVETLLAAKPNVLVLWHRNDPGLYECWNIGIRLARTEYVSNANVDDLRDPRQVMTLLRHLETRPHVAVAATALVPFQAYPSDGVLPPVTEAWYADQAGRFEFLDLARLVDPASPRLDPHNIPHCMPIWRKTLHDRYGWFDESRFGTYADWAFWLKVLEDGGTGWLEPEALSFYFVNPASHNRRGDDLEVKHRAVEADFLGSFIARINRQPLPHRELPANTPRKLCLFGRELHYGQHRNAFSNMIVALEPLDKGPGGCRFVPFLERQFVWGDFAADGEAASSDPRPITEPWIGILHVPFDAPEWFEPSVSPERFFETALFQDSLPACRGLITLCADLERDLRHYLPGLPTLSLRHPTDLDVRTWSLEAYAAAPCVVQVGDWLRWLQAIHRLRAPGHRRVMLLKSHTKGFMEREIAVFGDVRDPEVEMRYLVPNEEYDELLASSVVLCLMYATAANNVVIECIARATPIIINPLPGVVEYLGEDYPLYACDEKEANFLLAKPQKIKEAHFYLLQHRVAINLSYSGFCNNFAASGFYAMLP
jgi:hypothetical protein